MLKKSVSKLLVSIIAITTVVAPGLGAIAHAAPAAAPEHIISTLYAYPTLPAWSQVESAAPTVSGSIVDICAPNGSGSGCNGTPANAVNPAWTPTINALTSSGIKPLYYISTNYGATALSVVEGEMQNAISWYGINDPMFDEMQPSGTCTNGGSSLPCTTYYADLYNYAVNDGAGEVEFNPGTSYNVSSADMFGSKEVIQVFEGTAASFETTSFPSWMSSYPAGEFAATLYSGTAAKVGTDVNDAVKDGIGNFYENDETGSINYATLPAYWSTEVSDVAATNNSPEHIISTLYAYPTLPAWSQVESAAPTVSGSIVDICAPNGSGSGCNGTPANAVNPAWTPTINALTSSGIKPLYYISTNYGATALSVVEGEMQNAISWYGINDPMFDEMQPSGTCTNGGSSLPCTTYYADLYNYAVNDGAGEVEFNPGTSYNVSSADMFGSKEVIQVFEGTAASFETTSFPSWMSSYPAGEFAATLYSGTAAKVGTDVNDAVKDGIGNFYENDETGSINYATLPAYWSTEVSDVAAIQ